jgi:SH3-like domain-containing protein
VITITANGYYLPRLASLKVLKIFRRHGVPTRL